MTTRPNIVIITTDQQRRDTLSCYGNRSIQTPVLDRLAADGARLDRAYCANPVCSPARASLFGGRYVSRHGVFNCGVDLPMDQPLISHRLAEVGYRTHSIGKMHFNAWQGAADSMETHKEPPDRFPAFTGPYYGFQTVELSMGHGHYGIRGHYGVFVRSHSTAEQAQSYKEYRRLSPVDFAGAAHDSDLPMKLHQSVWVADRAIEFLERRDASQPFLLALGFADPHHPHVLPKEWTDRVDPGSVDPPDCAAGELDDKPEHFRAAHRGVIDESSWKGTFRVAGQIPPSDFDAIDPYQARLGRAYYLAMVKIIDQQMGRILQAMDKLDLTRDTLIVFTSDHGELLGDHGLWAKGPFHYEQAVNIPLILHWPAGIPRGRATEAVVSHVDLVPTILAALGLPPAVELDGVNLLPLLRGEVDAAHDAVFVEHVDDPAKLRLKTIITATHKLTRYAGQNFGELYDLAADPREKRNLWDVPANCGMKANLLGRLLDFLEPVEKRGARPVYV